MQIGGLKEDEDDKLRKMYLIFATLQDSLPGQLDDFGWRKEVGECLREARKLLPYQEVYKNGW